jgi:hypothetical protein
MNRRIIVALAAALATAAAAEAQESTVAPAPEPIRTEGVQAGGRGGGRGVVAGAVETRVTPGRPYSAETVNETVQVLGDGNRINRSSTTRVYRDGEGRTRRETLDTDGSVRSIAIYDPVAHVSYTLDPKTKAAYKSTINVVMPLRTPGLARVVDPAGDPERQAVASARVVTGTITGGVVTGTVSGGTGRGAAIARTPEPGALPNVNKEELPPQNIEGVMAAGTRTTTVIPAGQIGNAQEIRIVSERWFSDDLQVLVLTKHSDPRSGETTYRLRNILRAEPDPSLFTVPADYTIQQRGGRQ